MKSCRFAIDKYVAFVVSYQEWLNIPGLLRLKKVMSFLLTFYVLLYF